MLRIRSMLRAKFDRNQKVWIDIIRERVWVSNLHAMEPLNFDREN